MAKRSQAAFGLVFGALGVVIVLVLTESLDELLPDGLAEHVARNDEGYVFALLMAVWIAYAREPVLASSQRRVITGAVAAGFVAAGALLLIDGVPGTLATLNETCFALAVLVPYVQLRRPVPRWAWVVPVSGIVIPPVGAGRDDITDLAEFFGFLVVVPVALDVVDRAILDRTETRSPARVVAWTVLVAVAAIAFHALRPDDPSGLVDEVQLYLSRTVEVLVAVLILNLWFSVLRPGVAPGVRHDVR